MSREALDKQRKRRVSKAEQELGQREGHYNLGDKFVRIWVEFYPRVHWLICDCERSSGADVPDTSRILDSKSLASLENWL